MDTGLGMAPSRDRKSGLVRLRDARQGDGHAGGRVVWLAVWLRGCVAEWLGERSHACWAGAGLMAGGSLGSGGHFVTA